MQTIDTLKDQQQVLLEQFTASLLYQLQEIGYQPEHLVFSLALYLDSEGYGPNVVHAAERLATLIATERELQPSN
jgi:hypothetical protein